MMVNHSRVFAMYSRYLFVIMSAASALPAHVEAAITITSNPIAGPPDTALFTGVEGAAGSNLNALLNPSGDSYWASYTLGVKSTAGEKIDSLDVTLTTTGPSGGFLQRWNLNDDGTAYDASTPSSTNIANGDSHLIPGAVFLIAPTENRIAKSSDAATTTPGFSTPHIGEEPGVRNWAIGTSMSGFWGYDAAEIAAQGSVVNFAYLVVPRTLNDLRFQVNVGTLLPNGLPGQGAHLTELVSLDSVSVGDRNLGSLPLGTSLATTLPANFSNSESLAWKLLSLTGPGGSISGAAVNPTTGQFTWDSTGAALGSYSAVIRGRSLFDDDTGTLFFNLVPEPAVFALVSIALVSIANGTSWRKSSASPSIR
jgi:hypothetical protein